MLLRSCRVVCGLSCLLLYWGCSSSGNGPGGGTGGRGSGGASNGAGGTSSVGTGGAGNGSGGAVAGSGGTGTGGASATGGVNGGGGGSNSGGAVGSSGGAGPGATGGSNGTGGGSDAGASDAAPVTDAAGSGGAGAAGAPTCGAMRPAITGITGTEGLVIGPDGTIYFSQPSSATNANFLGRYRPPYTQPELRWADMKGAAFGITIDPKGGFLYAGSRPLRKLVKISVADAPVVTNLVDVEPTINGVTLGEDGAVYYTDQGTGQVYRVTPDGAKTQVTTSPVSDANGIAFGPDGGLYVLTYAAARVTRLTVTAGKETGRTAFATITGGRNADGIAFDAVGQLYVTATGLFKISADGQTQSKLPCTTVGSANVEFGAGALSCTDIYSVGSGGMNRCANDTPGMNVPWHRR